MQGSEAYPKLGGKRKSCEEKNRVSLAQGAAIISAVGSIIGVQTNVREVHLSGEMNPFNTK